MYYTNYDLSSVVLGLVAVLPLGVGALYVLGRAEKRRMPWSRYRGHFNVATHEAL